MSTVSDPYTLTPFHEKLAAVIQWFYRRVVKIYLREVVVLETDITEGTVQAVRRPSLRKHLPTLLIANHPNGLIDPLVIYATAQTTLRAVAKSTLWNQAILRPFLRMAGAVPVKRAQDADEIARGQNPAAAKLKTTQEFIDLVSRAMCRHTFVMFPEGISHENPELAPLKTGAARMLLAAAAYVAKNPDKSNPIYRPQDLSFQAVGLYFDEYYTFRSRGLVHYGRRCYLDEVFSPEEFAAVLTNPTDSGNVLKLTAAMERELKALIPEAPDPKTRELTRRLASLLFEANRKTKISDIYHFELVIKNLLEQFKSIPKEEARAVRAKVNHYFEELNRFGFRDSLVRDLNLDKNKFMQRQLRIQITFWLQALLFLPISLLGILLFYGPYRLTGRIAFNLAEDMLELSTYKLIAGFVFILIADLFYTVLALTLFGPYVSGLSFLLLALLPSLSALAALIFAEKLQIRFDGLKVLLSKNLRKQIYIVGDQREALIDELLNYLN